MTNSFWLWDISFAFFAIWLKNFFLRSAFIFFRLNNFNFSIFNTELFVFEVSKMSRSIRQYFQSGNIFDNFTVLKYWMRNEKLICRKVLSISAIHRCDPDWRNNNRVVGFEVTFWFKGMACKSIIAQKRVGVDMLVCVYLVLCRFIVQIHPFLPLLKINWTMWQPNVNICVAPLLTSSI